MNDGIRSEMMYGNALNPIVKKMYGEDTKITLKYFPYPQMVQVFEETTPSYQSPTYLGSFRVPVRGWDAGTWVHEVTPEYLNSKISQAILERIIQNEKKAELSTSR